MAWWSRKQKEVRDTGFTRWVDMSSTYTEAGVNVTTTTAIGLPVVYRCASLNSTTIAALPVDCLRKIGDKRQATEEPVWLSQPNPEYDWMQFIQEVQTSLELDGNAFILKVTVRGRVVELWQLDPGQVQVNRTNSGTVVYSAPLKDGSYRELPPGAVLHIKAFTMPRAVRGISPIQACMLAIGRGLAVQQFGARFFGEGSSLSGVIEVPKEPGPDAVKALKETFKVRHGGVSRSHAVGILTGGAVWKPISISPEESQFIQTMRFTDAQISWLFGVPPQYTTDAEGAKGYVTGVTAGKMMWLQAGLLYRIVRLEKSFSSLMLPDEYLKFNLRAFLRPDPTEQAALMQAEIQNSVRTPNEWRALLDLDPVDGGDLRILPSNMQLLNEDGELDKPDPPPKPNPIVLPNQGADGALSITPEVDDEA
jgi:HK97 family phage portal protein